jgi:DNA primase
MKMREAGPAREYLVKRRLDEKAQEDFIIGYAPNGMSAMVKWAEKYGYSLEELESAGVIKPPLDARDSGYHRFGSRLMFTICDKQGRVVAFSGRQLVANKNSGKYVNSPETEIYVKSRSLYGIYFAKNEISRQDRCILVEGYLDVLSMHQLGIRTSWLQAVLRSQSSRCV